MVLFVLPNLKKVYQTESKRVLLQIIFLDQFLMDILSKKTPKGMLIMARLCVSALDE